MRFLRWRPVVDGGVVPAVGPSGVPSGLRRLASRLEAAGLVRGVTR